ncbi:hypothetical protein [Ligilactobacillus equi]|uniref:Uncharacterized protein n=1 Tax=Ligilactobacillus equi DSM 15833 = JCM 10991 TaxID=1423740 RepID=A0A0R1TYY3_9LACO|nr:hypothetical protein [Ligilactobacillus equi]KRL84314.1 hypothetical protein FC36_GL000237 [Ligilactobacillus equi DSM 15833 = JCM 10991]
MENWKKKQVFLSGLDLAINNRVSVLYSSCNPKEFTHPTNIETVYHMQSISDLVSEYLYNDNTNNNYKILSMNPEEVINRLLPKMQDLLALYNSPYSNQVDEFYTEIDAIFESNETLDQIKKWQKVIENI